ncbi:MAG: hypothetical protein J0H88_00745 [Sphingomonadales bacterium]|nr:hypothetical protein [Sphingomonadales bacterium]
MRSQTSPGVTVHGIGHRGSEKADAMTADQRIAHEKARTIHDTHGARGTVVIAEMIGSFAAMKDHAQVALWTAIAAAFIKLQGDAQAQWDTARHLRTLLDSLL